MITPYNSVNYFTYMPNELFVAATAGKQKSNAVPVEEIETLVNFSETSKDLKNKVDLCWGAFILHVGKSLMLIPGFYKKLDYYHHNLPQKARKLIIEQYSVLKEWKDLDLNTWRTINPKILEYYLEGDNRQCLVNENFDNPELIILKAFNEKILRVDLKTNTCIEIKLDALPQPNRFFHFSCMASSDKWVAVCHKTQAEFRIALFDIDTGKRFNTILFSNLNSIQQLHYKDGYLYVLCKDQGNQSQLFRYDSSDWDALPKTLKFPEKENVMEFYFESKILLFRSILQNTKYRLSAIKIKNCFTDLTSTFVKAASQLNRPIIRSANGAIFTISPVYEALSNEPSIALERLKITDTMIAKECLQKLPVDISKIDDFIVSFDKIFILRKYQILCFDLLNGAFLTHFAPMIQSIIGTYFLPKLAILSPNILFLFSAQKYVNFTGVEQITAVLKLDFGRQQENNQNL